MVFRSSPPEPINGLDKQKGYSPGTLKGFHIITIIFLVITLPLSYQKNDGILTALHLAYIAITSLSTIALLRSPEWKWGGFSIVIPGQVVLLYSLYLNPQESILMVVIFPMLIFFLIDRKTANFLSLGLIVATLLILYNSYGQTHAQPYPITMILLAYIIVHSLAFLYEANRDRNESLLRKSSLIDFLTQSWNKRAFERDLFWFIQNSTRKNIKFCLLLIDIDNFKRVNDNHGHQIGDMVLQEISEHIKKMLRNNDLLYRIGGDEFAAILPDTDQSGANILAERARESFNELETLSVFQISLSIGITEFNTGCCQEELFNAADKALYIAKESGKNRIHTVVIEIPGKNQ